VARAAVGRADGQAREELAAERPGQVVDRAALLGDRLADLGPDLVPDPGRARRGERLDLQRRALEQHGGGRHDRALLVGLHPQLHAVDAGQPQGTQVDARAALGPVGDVPRAALALGRVGAALGGLRGRLCRRAVVVDRTRRALDVGGRRPALGPPGTSEHAHACTSPRPCNLRP
jgi:hypothetical protein